MDRPYASGSGPQEQRMIKVVKGPHRLHVQCSENPRTQPHDMQIHQDHAPENKVMASANGFVRCAHEQPSGVAG